MGRVTSSTQRNGHTTALAALLALVLLLGSLLSAATLAIGPSAHAEGPAAVFYGYVIPEPGRVLPRRIRALSEGDVVCGSADVARVGYANAGFYAIAVVSDAAKEGCPLPGEFVRLVLVYGLIDDDVFVGPPVPFVPGAVAAVNLIRTAPQTTP